MSFTPSNPLKPWYLICYCSTNTRQAEYLVYRNAGWRYYKTSGGWVQLKEKEYWDFGIENLIPIYVSPEIIPYFSVAESAGSKLSIKKVLKFEIFNHIDPTVL